MSPYEMDKCREPFEAAAKNLGWQKKSREDHHERDWDCSWKVIYWVSPSGAYLIDESKLSQGMVDEIIRLARSHLDLDAPIETLTVGQALKNMVSNG